MDDLQDCEQIAYFGEKRIEDMSREELIEAVRFLGKQLHQQYEFGRKTAQMHKEFAEVRRLRGW